MTYQSTVLAGIVSATCLGVSSTITIVNAARNYPNTQEVLKSIAIPAAFTALSAAYSINNYAELNPSDRIGIPIFGIVSIPLTMMVHMLLRSSDRSGLFTEDSDSEDAWMRNDPMALAVLDAFDRIEDQVKADEDEDLKTLP